MRKSGLLYIPTSNGDNCRPIIVSASTGWHWVQQTIGDCSPAYWIISNLLWMTLQLGFSCVLFCYPASMMYVWGHTGNPWWYESYGTFSRRIIPSCTYRFHQIQLVLFSSLLHIWPDWVTDLCGLEITRKEQSWEIMWTVCCAGSQLQVMLDP